MAWSYADWESSRVALLVLRKLVGTPAIGRAVGAPPPVTRQTRPPPLMPYTGSAPPVVARTTELSLSVPPSATCCHAVPALVVSNVHSCAPDVFVPRTAAQMRAGAVDVATRSVTCPALGAFAFGAKPATLVSVSFAGASARVMSYRPSDVASRRW